MTLSLYKKITDVTSPATIALDIFLDNIRSGVWQDNVLKYRAYKDPAVKTSLPSVTVSGRFSTRRDDALIEHSGYICIDIDHVDPIETKSIICADSYVYAAFTSCSGEGLAVIFKINGKKHRDAFDGITNYLFNQYGIIVDSSGINESRARFVSYDPDIYINPKPKLFAEYLPKKQTTRKISRIVFVQNDFETIIQQIQSRHLDITYNYVDWRNIGFGIADKFGEAGREYFHQISEVSSKYNSTTTDKQFDACLRSHGSGISIATFYYLAKQAGIETQSTETREIIQLVSAKKRAGESDATITETFKKFSDNDPSVLQEILPQVDKDTNAEDVSLIEQVETEIRTNFEIRKNVISRQFELFRLGKWQQLEAADMNDIYIYIKKHFDRASYDMVERIITSRHTPEYNPLLDFIAAHKDDPRTVGNLHKLSETITSDFGLSGETRAYFIAKWFVGMISSIHGQHSPLMVDLVGGIQGTGKTEWLRRLLPKDLQKYYGESKLDAGKDDEILMTQMLLIVDDEMGGKTRKESTRLKELTSKQVFSLREPYGRHNVQLPRLAVLGGTSNDTAILNDPTGNRRRIPIHVAAINHEMYNSIDKTDLFMEAYWLWKEGKLDHNLTKQDIKLLADHSGEFEQVSMEEEFFSKYYRVPENEFEGDFYTNSEIVADIHGRTLQRISSIKLGQVLTKLGIERKTFGENRTKKGYKLVKE